jgi:hypothetical protein
MTWISAAKKDRVQPQANATSEGKSNMPRNESTIDRALRIIVGLVLLYLAFTGRYTPWTWIGVVPLLTGLVGFCPLYRVLGMSTCKVA